MTLSSEYYLALTCEWHEVSEDMRACVLTSQLTPYGKIGSIAFNMFFSHLSSGVSLAH